MEGSTHADKIFEGLANYVRPYPCGHGGARRSMWRAPAPMTGRR